MSHLVEHWNFKAASLKSWLKLMRLSEFSGMKFSYIDFPEVLPKLIRPLPCQIFLLDFRCLRLIILLIQICHCHSILLFFPLSRARFAISLWSRRYRRGSLPRPRWRNHVTLCEKRKDFHFPFSLFYLFVSFMSQPIFCILDRHKNNVREGWNVWENGTYFMHCWCRDILDVC